MAFCISTTQLPFQKVLPLTITMLFFLLPSAHPINFSYPKFGPNQPRNITFIPESVTSNEGIELTRNTLIGNIKQSTGRAIYSDRVRIWDSKSRKLTDFNTQFSFNITGIINSNKYYGDGFTFFLSPNRSTIPIPPGAAGGNLGIYSDTNSTENQLVAIEFDTFPNPDWDPLLLIGHVGININSRVSLKAIALKPTRGDLIYEGDALVSYSASTQNLSVFLSMDVNGTSPGFGDNPDLSLNVDLRDVLPEWVEVGFSASTGEGVELHQIRSWKFNSTLEIREAGTGGTDPSVVNNNGEQPKNEDGKKTGLIAGLVVCGAVLSAGIGGLVLLGLKRKRDKRRNEEGVAFDVEMNDEFEKRTGPKRCLLKLKVGHTVFQIQKTFLLLSNEVLSAVDSSFAIDSAYVGLALLGEVGSWERECKGYQFWTRADTDGFFMINYIRTGDYNLYAWVPGFIGDHKNDVNITVTKGCDIDLGDLVYEPPRAGPTLWEIGIPDQTVAEFYVRDPNPNYINIGVSDYRKDWFFAQVTRKKENNTYKGTTWKIKFTIDRINQSGTYNLRIAIASATVALLQVRLNDMNANPPLFSGGQIGRDNSIARHGIHGLYWLFNIEVPGTLLVEGENTIFLTQPKSTSPFQGIMYDYIRLEGPPDTDTKKE
ncbi:hypothetical protein MRB53_011803 [Persea americana]|uniref:Uncharacterized protein n=1 Tax=Persea americana TaxID=3435 RepID=A0ACC2LWR6_PERAE|nr:hypothetical protein MRB53_011803 [Persea americana]